MRRPCRPGKRASSTTLPSVSNDTRPSRETLGCTRLSMLLPRSCLYFGAAVLASPRGDVDKVLHCDCGFEVRSAGEAGLVAAGRYYLLRLVDTAGSSNGFVCGLAQPDSVRDAFCKNGGTVACLLEQLGLPHYVFKDDDSPAHATA